MTDHTEGEEIVVEVPEQEPTSNAPVEPEPPREPTELERLVAPLAADAIDHENVLAPVVHAAWRAWRHLHGDFSAAPWAEAGDEVHAYFRQVAKDAATPGAIQEDSQLARLTFAMRVALIP